MRCLSTARLSGNVVLVGVLAGILAACAHANPAVSGAPKTASAPVAAPTAAAFGPDRVDAALREEWKKAGLVPAPLADDATFLRRAYVDVVGTVPTAEVTAKFLSDGAKDKRARLIDGLLASPEYAEHWMNYWDDVLMGTDAKGNLVDRVAFRTWLRGRFAENARWDRVVTELVSATGQNGDGGPRIKGPAMQVALPAADADEPEIDPTKINGAVNYTLRFEQNPQDLGGSASRVFLGVQIQCAQCHDHKTESWKQDDFRRFTSAFFRSRVEPIDRGKQMGSIRRVALEDMAGVPPRFVRNGELAGIAKAKPTAFDGTDLAKGAGTRKALASWITSRQNPWFARAFVNRMWGHYLGRGFVDPVDDLRPSNPASAPALLDELARDFAAHDFDVQYLVRTICATEAYQLAASPNAKIDPENKLWARFRLVPLGPEELSNAILRVTGLEQTAARSGVKNPEAIRAAIVRQYAFVFDTDEDDDVPDYSGNVSQALTLLNGQLVAEGTRALPGSFIGELVKAPATDEEKVEKLAIRVLARHATADERARWVRLVNAGAPPIATTGVAPSDARPRPPNAGPLNALSRRAAVRSPKAMAYEDLLWSLLNSSEFTFNH